MAAEQKKQKTSLLCASSQSEQAVCAEEPITYKINDTKLAAKFKPGADRRYRAEEDLSIVVDQDKIKAVDESFAASKSSKPECKKKGCTNPATHGAVNPNAKAKWCAEHKKEGNVEMGCSLCPGKVTVTINDTTVCLAHMGPELRTLRLSDTPITITAVRGSKKCACGTRAMYALSNDEKKKTLVCKQCAQIWGHVHGVEFVSTRAPRDESARACVGPLCATKEPPPVGAYITSEEKRYCASDRDKVITDEKDEDKPFGERTTFKYASHPCEGRQCTVTRCYEESVCVADDKALCLKHWTVLDDDAKKAFEWTGTCYKRAIFGPDLQNGDVQSTKQNVRCGDHKLVSGDHKDVDNTSPRCIMCVATMPPHLGKATMVKKYGECCASCKDEHGDQWYPLVRQTVVVGSWRNHAKELLAGATIKDESREKLLDEDKLARVDVRIDHADDMDDDQVDLFEIDEKAHFDRYPCVELEKLRNIIQIPGKRTRLVRVNPDRPRHKVITEKISRKEVAELIEEKGRKLTLDEILAMSQVDKENLRRTVNLIEEARRVPTGHVIYLDYPLNSKHLVVGNVPLVDHSDVEIRRPDKDNKYADMIIVPQRLFFPPPPPVCLVVDELYADLVSSTPINFLDDDSE